MVTHAVLASVPTQLRPRRKATTEYPISSSSRIGEIQTSKQDRAKQELSSAIASTRDAALSGGAGRRLTKIVWRGAPADSSFPPRPPAPPPPSISSPMGGGEGVLRGGRTARVVGSASLLKSRNLVTVRRIYRPGVQVAALTFFLSAGIPRT